MKQLLTLLMVASVTSLYAQKSAPARVKKSTSTKQIPQPFTEPTKPIGIGKIVIGQTIFDSLESITGLVMERSSDFLGAMYTPGQSGHMVEIAQTDKVENKYVRDAAGPSIPDYRVVRISKWELGDLDFHNVKLVLYRDTLFSFVSELPGAITEIMDYKYGKPEIYSHKDTITCTIKLTGASVQYEEYTITSTWESGPAKAVLFLQKKYSDKCEAELSSLFTMSDEVKNEAYRQAVNKAKAESKEKELKQY